MAWSWPSKIPVKASIGVKLNPVALRSVARQ